MRFILHTIVCTYLVLTKNYQFNGTSKIGHEYGGDYECIFVILEEYLTTLIWNIFGFYDFLDYIMDRHTVSRQSSMSMVGNSKFGEKVVKGPLIFADCQKILLKLLQPELLFRGWLSHERALHTRSINGMSHRSRERKQFSAAFNRVCFASMFYIYPFYCMLLNQKFVIRPLRQDS